MRIGLFEIEHNLFSGTLPLSIGTMTTLRRCFRVLVACHANVRLAHIFVPSHFVRVERLSLSNNSLSGEIPSEIFLLSKLGTYLPPVLYSWRKVRRRQGRRLQSTLFSADMLLLYDNHFNGSFACPNPVAICLVGCNNTNDTTCRSLN